MVLTKMESRVHAWVVMPTGMGARKRTANPIATDKRNGTGLAPWTREMGKKHE
jgi:hypothetical protein